MPTAERTMKNPFPNFHLFELDDIIKEYELLLIKPNTVLEENHHENQESIQA